MKKMLLLAICTVAVVRGESLLIDGTSWVSERIMAHVGILHHAVG